MKHARISAADIVRAREAAESAGLRLAGIEKRPDGTVKLEFADLAFGKRRNMADELYGSQA